MINMTKEELDSIEELIVRKIQLAEVMGGLTSQDKKFINLWNYAMQLQNNWNELKKWCKETIENANKCLNDPNENWDEDANDYVLARKFQLEETLKKMQELEGDK